MKNYIEKEIWFERDGLKIYSLSYIPKEPADQRFPTIIIGHGYGGSYQDNLNCAERYVAEGFAVCSFDFCGGTPFARSEGRTQEMSVVTEMKDMIAVYEGLLMQDFVDPARVVLWGESMGGYVAALAAAKLAEKNRERGDINRPWALVLFYPAFNIRDEGRKRYGSIGAVEAEGRREIPLGKCFYQDIWDIDTWSEIPKYDGPVLILHGDEDDIVPIAYSEHTRDVYARSTYKIIPGAGHGFFNKTGEHADRIVTDFLKTL